MDLHYMLVHLLSVSEPFTTEPTANLRVSPCDEMLEKLSRGLMVGVVLTQYMTEIADAGGSVLVP